MNTRTRDLEFKPAQCGWSEDHKIFAVIERRLGSDRVDSTREYMKPERNLFACGKSRVKAEGRPPRSNLNHSCVLLRVCSHQVDTLGIRLRSVQSGCCMAYIEERHATGRRLNRFAEWKNADDAGRHPRDKASPAMSQILGMGIDVIQSDKARSIVVKGHGNTARRLRDLAPDRRGYLIRLQLAASVLGSKLRNNARQPNE